MAFPFTRRFRAQYPRFTRTFLLTLCFLLSFGVGFAYASWAMVCRAGRCPSENALELRRRGEANRPRAVLPDRRRQQRFQGFGDFFADLAGKH